MKRLLAFAFFLCLLLPESPGQKQNNSFNSVSGRYYKGSVGVWEERVIIPTYLTGDPDPNPMFYFGRAYQGAEGRVYPYPLYDKLTGIKKEKEYNMVYLENEYIKIGILPEIGGRIFSAVDKTNNYNFIYTQHVVKPALIGMLGAWISGGIEWNVPHHHRATSFLPVQYKLENNSDSSKTVWVGELELRQRTRWAVGYTLRPGKSYIEVTVRVFNTSPFVQTMLCFANAAVHANENYQVIFPPSTQFVTYHSKREFTTWPIATTIYNGADFTKGVDVSWYKNHYSANSLFAWNYIEDFIGGYDHGKDAGIVCFADHNTVPGKKFWTWGNSPYGKMWDQALTDADGPYLELMVGSYSDNQPDYSWLQPFEVKDIKQIWYPVRGIGGMKNVNENAAVNLDFDTKGNAIVGIYTTSLVTGATVILKDGDKVFYQVSSDMSPGTPFTKTVNLPSTCKKENISVSLAKDGKELISFKTPVIKNEPMPEPVIQPKSPDQISSIEELYLTGRRVEQFHNPALSSEPYWKEAMRLDSLDTRVNTAMGIDCIKKAQFTEAERYFKRALVRLTASYTTPEEGEPFYYLGLALKAQNKRDEAYKYFYKSIWSEAWKAAGYYSLAQIDCSRGDFDKALIHVNLSINSNSQNVNCLSLKGAILRHKGDMKSALEIVEKAQKIDPLNTIALNEMCLLTQDLNSLFELGNNLVHFPSNVPETAVFYSDSGLWQEALTFLKTYAGNDNIVSPMVLYYLGYFSGKTGNTDEMKRYYVLAASKPGDYVFPFQYEAIDVLKSAIEVEPDDPMAPYYLGNLIFDWQPSEAIKLWEKSASLKPSFSICLRNLALGYANYENNLDKAIRSLELAVSCDIKYPMHFFELDELYQAAGISPEKRLAVMEENHEIVKLRDDALSHEIGLKVFAGKCTEAISLMKNRHFKVWEGGARFNVNDSWTDAYFILGFSEMDKKKYKEAIKNFKNAIEYPENLQTAKGTASGRSAEAAWWTGVAYEAAGDSKNAVKQWKSSVENLTRAMDDKTLPINNETVSLFFQALSLRKLGQKDKAVSIFNELVTSGNKNLENRNKVDFFAKFGQQQSQRSSLGMTHFIIGLGYLGLEKRTEAEAEFRKALEICPDQLYSKLFLQNNKML